MLSGGVSCAQSRADRQLQFDLSKIGMVMDNRQICEDKGGLQDYPSKVMDQVIAAGPKSVPILIAMLSDERIAPTQEPIICFWQDMTIGDIAFCVLSDLFLNADWTETTISLGGDQLNWFIVKHGRKALQGKWQALGDYKDQIFWDATERCFRLKA
jgi:hypothetical protein